MLTEKELKQKASACVTIIMGSISILPKQREGTEERLNSLMVSQKFVSNIEKCSLAGSKQSTLFSPLGSQAIEDEIRLFSIPQPLLANMQYSSDAIDPDAPYEKQTVNLNLLYDGLVYVAAYQQSKGHFNYRRHTAHLQKWLFDLLEKENAWETRQIADFPFPFSIDLYILPEFPEGFDASSYSGYEVVSSWSRNIVAWIREEKTISPDSVAREIMALYTVWLQDKCHEYVSALALNLALTSESDRASSMVGHIIDETLTFHDINVLNLIKRIQHTRSLGKQLARVYALMANLDRIEKSYNRATTSVREVFPFADLDKVFNEMLVSNLPTSEETVFTHSVNEMLREDLSEIRAQLNYQFLLVSALITFAAVIIAAFIK